MKVAAMFAGQNSIEAGMGEQAWNDSEEAKRTFDTASTIFEQDMAEICFGSRTGELPQFAQQAVVTAQIAEYHRLYDVGLRPDLLMPHSVGEFATLAIAKVTSERNTFILTKVRAEATAKANKNRPGEMAAILGITKEEVMKLLHNVNTKLQDVAGPAAVYLANQNWTFENVVSGHPLAIARLERTVSRLRNMELVRRLRLEREKLKVIPGAFHSPHNGEAVPIVEAAFRAAPLSRPEIRILGNHAMYLDDPTIFAEYFSRQLEFGVNWMGMMDVASRDGIRGFKEVGGQGVLEKFVKRHFEENAVQEMPYGEIIVIEH